ncbi:MAG: HD domain-containing protein [Treponema sp.]|nr:HD domain-containing protein [Treponema sp.]
MNVRNEIPIYDFVCAISEAIDLVSPVLNRHHKKVAYIAGHIALQMNLPNSDVQDIVLASMLHDIGAFSIGERIEAQTLEYHDSELNRHAFLGYKLLKNFRPLARAAKLIRYHHADYHSAGYNVPLGSYVIHLADRVAILFDENREVLGQVMGVVEKISKKYQKFHPASFIAFLRLVNLEYVWVEAFLPSFERGRMQEVRFSKEVIEPETLRCFAKIVAQIIDFRSRFTATHSCGVAAVVRELTAAAGFSERECKLMEIAGFLHDLGKLSVSNEILEKNGALSMEDFNAIRKHTYYTYSVLNKVSGMEDIAAWAAHHHEKQDGSGYPFHTKGEDISRLERIMTVADILTALAEDRPYRAGMDREKVMEILFTLANQGEIDRGIVEIAERNFPKINEARIKAQEDAWNEYEAFNSTKSPFAARISRQPA